MKTLKLGQKIKVGKYECMVKFGTFRYYINTEFKSNEDIITQFLPKQELIKKFGLENVGYFPYCDTLEKLTEVVEYLKSFEKSVEFKRGDRILVWNKDGISKVERIFFEYLDGYEFPFMCVDKSDEDYYKSKTNFSTTMWKFAEQIQIPKKIKITKAQVRKAFNCAEFEIVE